MYSPTPANYTQHLRPDGFSPYNTNVRTYLQQASPLPELTPHPNSISAFHPTRPDTLPALHPTASEMPPYPNPLPPRPPPTPAASLPPAPTDKRQTRSQRCQIFS